MPKCFVCGRAVMGVDIPKQRGRSVKSYCSKKCMDEDTRRQRRKHG